MIYFFSLPFFFCVVSIALEHDGIVTFNDDDELNDSCHSKIDKYADYKYAQANSIGQNL